MAAFLKQFWIFKSLTNFSIFGLVTSGTGYFYFRYQNDKKFDHPIFKESLRLLEQEKQIQELIGVPIYIDTGLTSRATITDKIINSSFPIKGPRGKLNIELAGESKTQGAIENSLNRAQNAELTEEARNARIKEVQDFYIPDPQVLTEIDKVRSQNADQLNTSEIPKDGHFWKLNYLYGDINNEYRIVLVPRQKENDQQKGNEVASQFKPNPWKKTLKQVLDEENARYRSLEDDKDKSEEEIEQLRKFRMQETYRKVGYVRLYMGAILAGSAMVGYILIQKYKRKNVLGNVLHSQAISYIKRNDLVRSELGKNPRFLQQIRGAAIDDEANFEIDAIGESKTGTFKVSGKFDKKKSEWELHNIDFILKGRKGEELSRKKLL